MSIGLKSSSRVRMLVALACSASAALSGCGGKTAQPFAPAPLQPPLIAAVFPPARAFGVPYETSIWVEFVEPLDPATVDTRTVFLKVDTRRVSADISYEAATRRIHIQPRARLDLQQVYTVEITPQVRTTAGGALDEMYFWQFVTNSVRHLESPDPPNAALDESPFRLVAWSATDGDSVHYDVWIGTDSSVVASRSAPRVARVATAVFVPRARWTHGTTYFWTVTVENRGTGEKENGPVWRFDVLPAGRPVQSMEITFSEWGYKNISASSSVVCNGRTMVSGPTFTSAFRWNIGGVSSLKLADAVAVMRLQVNLPAPFLNSQMFEAQRSWTACTVGLNEAPIRGQLLATASQTQDFVTYQSDSLTAYVEASLRGFGSGHMLLTPANVTYYTPAEPNPSYTPKLTLHYYP